MPPKVSIVTVVLNRATTIADTIDSIRQQDYPHIEYIVIDGHSTDGTVEIVGRNRDRVNVLVSEIDGGIYAAMNKGLRLSTGDIVATLNGDDTYSGNNIVSAMVNLMERDSLDAAYGDLVYIDAKRPNKIIRFWNAGQYRPGAFRRGWQPPHPTFFCRRSLFERYGYYLEHYRTASDFEFMLRLLEKHKVRVGYLPRVLVRMRTGGDSNRLSGLVGQHREILDSLRLNGLSASSLFFLWKGVWKLRQFIERPDAGAR